MSYIVQTLAAIEQERDQELRQAQQRLTNACNWADSDLATGLRALQQREMPPRHEFIRIVGLAVGFALGMLFGELIDSVPLLLILTAVGFFAGLIYEEKLYQDALDACLGEKHRRELALHDEHDQACRAARSAYDAEEKRLRRNCDERLKRARAQYDANVRRYRTQHARKLAQDFANQSGPLFWMTYHDGLFSALRDAPRGIANILTDITVTFRIGATGFQVDGKNASGRELFRDEFQFHAAAQPDLRDIEEIIGFSDALTEGLKQKLGELCDRERFDQRYTLEVRRMEDAEIQLIYHGETRPAARPAPRSGAAAGTRANASAAGTSPERAAANPTAGNDRTPSGKLFRVIS